MTRSNMTEAEERAWVALARTGRLRELLSMELPNASRWPTAQQIEESPYLLELRSWAGRLK